MGELACVRFAESGTAELIVGRFGVGEDGDEGNAWENPETWT
jgi:hypothetical protein